MALQSNRLTAADYAENFSDIHPPFESRDAALVEANRCLFCYGAPCTKSCPTDIDVPKFIKQISSGNIKGSAHTILSANIFGGGCSKVCPVEKLCEGSCVFNLMDEKPIAVAKLQRYSTEPAIENKWDLFDRKPSNGKKVAVIGSGPAGLSCAHALARKGTAVTVYEKEARAGGLMTYGIAAYKVTPEFCQSEVDFITSIGDINIRFGKELNRNIFLDDLKSEYDAVFLGTGLGLAKQLNIPGEDPEGVVNALTFIHQIRDADFSDIAVGGKVVVIGMGMAAIDAATQAKRLGANEVTLIYRRTEAEMPCTEAELNIARLDGCQIIWLTAPLEIIGVNGKANRIVCSRMKLGEPDSDGRAIPEDTGETVVVEADMIINATGQIPFLDIATDNNLQHYNGKIQTSTGGITSIGGVFAGGDCVNGGREVVDAVQAGKEAAAAITSYLSLPV